MYCDKSCNLIETVIKLIKFLFDNNMDKKQSHKYTIFQSQ